MEPGIRHIGLVVENIDKALLFYRDLLGFKVFWDKTEHGNFVETILAVAKVEIRTIKMKGLNGCVLELLKFNANQLPCSKKLTKPGFSHIALTVSNLDNIINVLKAENIRFLSLPQISLDKKVKVVFCQDFEDNFLELVQEMP